MRPPEAPSSRLANQLIGIFGEMGSIRSPPPQAVPAYLRFLTSETNIYMPVGEEKN